MSAIKKSPDIFFRVVSQSVNGANQINFSYDADGLLTGVGALAITRDAQNGFVTTENIGSVARTYSFNGFGEVTSTADAFGGTQFLRIDYTLDNAGRITAKTETSGATTHVYSYAYDQAGRLTDVATDSAVSAHYTYDANANRTSYVAQGVNINATYDAQDRLLTYGDNTYSYTANGELNTKTNSTGTTLYTYDAFGGITKVVLPDNTVLEYITDSTGRRVAKKVNGVITKAWLYQGALMPVAELDANGNVVSRFVGAGGNVPEYMIKNGATYRIVTDQLGSVRMVVNAATGAVMQELRYDEFGVVTLDTNPGFTPFGFAGGLYDSDTKLTLFGARDYDAQTGRWTSKDPIGFNGGDTNLYGYVLQDPVNGVDPEGLAWYNTGVKIITGIVVKPYVARYVSNPVGQRIIAAGIGGAAGGAVIGAVGGVATMGVGLVPGIVIGTMIGLPVGMLTQMFKEITGIQEQQDKVMAEIEDRIKRNTRFEHPWPNKTIGDSSVKKLSGQQKGAFSCF